MDAWKPQHTSKTVRVYAEINLEDFETPQLLQELIERELLLPEEAARIMVRPDVALADDTSDLAIATHEMRMGRMREACIHLERHLGNEWIGALSHV